MPLIDVTKIPFNRDLGMVHSNQSDAIFMFPADARYHNHLGTFHAAVIFTLAEAAGGEFLQRYFSSLIDDVGAVVRRSEVKYRRPATSSIHGRATAKPADLDSVLDQLERRGRAVVTVEVKISDESGALVMTSSFEWFVTKHADSTIT
jgi:acyl-coenzyme A thioesterase PaaI-like protein